ILPDDFKRCRPIHDAKERVGVVETKRLEGRPQGLVVEPAASAAEPGMHAPETLVSAQDTGGLGGTSSSTSVIMGRLRNLRVAVLAHGIVLDRQSNVLRISLHEAP